MASDPFSDFVSYAMIALVSFLLFYTVLMHLEGGYNSQSSAIREKMTPKSAWDKKKEDEKNKINRKNALAVQKKLSQISKNANEVANQVQKVYAKNS